MAGESTMKTVSYQTEQAAIMGRIAERWVDEANVPRCPVAWPNAQFQPAGATHMQAMVNRQAAFNVDLVPDARRIRHPGLLTMTIRAPLNRGDGDVLELADHAADMFRNVTFDGITFRAPTVRDFGADGPWYVVQVDCPYWRDSIH